MIEALTVVVPVFNEEAGVEPSLSRLRLALAEAALPHELIVVNDGSTDGTAAILERFQGIHVVPLGRNHGYGAAIKHGVRAARSPWVLLTDGDASYPATNLPVLLAALEGMDMVIGARRRSDIHNPVSWNLSKRLAQGLLFLALGTHIPDVNSGMRLFRRDLALDLEPFLADGFSYSSGLTVAALRRGFKVRFETIEYTERRGESKVSPIPFTRAFLVSLARALRVPRS